MTISEGSADPAASRLAPPKSRVEIEEGDASIPSRCAFASYRVSRKREMSIEVMLKRTGRYGGSAERSAGERDAE